jgi:hypothetical protein
MRPYIVVLFVFAFSIYSSHHLLAQEFVIAPKNILQFMYGDDFRRIWASIDNKEKEPSFWQFRYDPIFIPEVNANGDLNIRKEKLPADSGWHVSLPIYFGTSQSNKLAYNQIVKAYNKEADLILDSNVSPLYVTNIHITIPYLSDHVPTAKFREASIDFSHPSSQFPLKIYAPNESSADRVVQFLTSGPRIDYVISFAAKETKQNSIKVKYQHLQKSQFYTVLNGLGTTSVYIHRDDMRQLTEDIKTYIDIQGTLEAPEHFDNEIFGRILSQLTKATNTDKEKFDQEKWKSTYNADDLKPDAISKKLNKMFTYDEGKEQWKYSGDVEISGKADVIGVIGAESKVKGSYSTEGLKDSLKQRDIEVDIEGNMIVAKSINLRQVNLNAFNSTGEFTSVMAYISNFRDPIQGTLDLSRSIRDNLVQPDLPTRVAALEKLPQGFIEGALIRRTNVFSYKTGNELPRKKTYYYHIKTPDRRGNGEMWRYDLKGYAYDNAIPLDFTWVGYYFKDATADEKFIRVGYPDPRTEADENLHHGQYTGKNGYLYLWFGPVGNYYLSFALDYLSGATGEKVIHQASDFNVVIVEDPDHRE